MIKQGDRGFFQWDEHLRFVSDSKCPKRENPHALIKYRYGFPSDGTIVTVVQANDIFSLRVTWEGCPHIRSILITEFIPIRRM